MVALITGGSLGLGLILAHEFGRHGARGHLRRDSAELQRASADLGARGKTAVTVPCDVSDRRQVETMVEAVARELSASRVCSS
jgi:NAD(P)-dependent dehydrogenase (short-subunit alcohol dehydrogenase family)